MTGNPWKDACTPVQPTQALLRKFPQAFRSSPPMLAGTVILEYVKCGKPSCRCAGGDLHGPYFYHFRRVGRRQKKTYVPKAELPAVFLMCRNRRTQQEMYRGIVRRQKAAMRAAKATIREIEGGR